MSEKLNKIAAARDRALKRRDDWDRKYKELDKKYHEQENTEIHEVVHIYDLTPEELSAIIQKAKAGIMAGDPAPTENEINKEGDDKLEESGNK